ncbi:MAG: hypothetical protein Ta2F_15300 [Termitinemataceae bacterium]|nr:MAG: hypothetical protein Ta2F_15300 [Termitinemataceae bacterium]
MLSITQLNPTGIESGAGTAFLASRFGSSERFGDRLFTQGKSQFSDYLSQIADSANNNYNQNQNNYSNSGSVGSSGIIEGQGDSAANEDAVRSKNAEPAKKDAAADREEDIKTADEDALYAEISKFLQQNSKNVSEADAESVHEIKESSKKSIDDAGNEISLAIPELKDVSIEENGENTAKLNKNIDKSLEAEGLSVKKPLLDKRGQEAADNKSALEAKTQVKDALIGDEGTPYDGKLRNAERENLRFTESGKTKAGEFKDDGIKAALDMGEARDELFSNALGDASRSGKGKGKGDDKKGEGKLEEKDAGVKKRKVSYEHQMKTNVTVAATEGMRAVTEEISTKSSSGKETEIVVNLKSESRSSSGGENRIFNDARPAASAESFLARELHQNLNGDIVRQASVVLREGGAGTIRLALKPESLGQVKIHLEMTDNKVTGKIVVESEEALRAFQQELKSLEESFKEGGFDTASLDLQLADGKAGQNNSEEARNMAEHLASTARYYEAQVDNETATGNAGLDYYVDGRSSTGVNVFA